MCSGDGWKVSHGAWTGRDLHSSLSRRANRRGAAQKPRGPFLTTRCTRQRPQRWAAWCESLLTLTAEEGPSLAQASVSAVGE